MSLLAVEQARKALAAGQSGLRSWQLAHSLFPDDLASAEIVPSLDLDNAVELRKRLEERRLVMQAPEVLGMVELWWRAGQEEAPSIRRGFIERITGWHPQEGDLISADEAILRGRRLADAATSAWMG